MRCVSRVEWLVRWDEYVERVVVGVGVKHMVLVWWNESGMCFVMWV